MVVLVPEARLTAASGVAPAPAVLAGDVRKVSLRAAQAARRRAARPDARRPVAEVALHDAAVPQEAMAGRTAVPVPFVVPVALRLVPADVLPRM